MLIYNIITSICIGLLVLELAFILVNLIIKKRPQRIAFLRTFKKGKCAIIFLTAIPLYTLGHIYAGAGFFDAFFRAISKILALVVLSYDTSTVKDLMANNGLYKFAIYFAFVLVALNAVVFTLSVTSQRIWSAYRARRAFTSSKNKLFIFGNNAESLHIYNSESERSKAIVDDISAEDKNTFYFEKTTFISSKSPASIIKRISRLLDKSEKEVVIVVNTKNEEKNIKICNSLISAIDTLSSIKGDKSLNLKAFVFGDSRYEAIYENIVKKSHGYIGYVNKYQKIAMDFIDKYPFAKFASEEHIDYKTSLVRDGVDINAVLIGFDKTNKQILLTSVANNQFIEGAADGPKLKLVNYHIFDGILAGGDKNLNYSYYRYKSEFSDADEGAYLPLPSLPANENYVDTGVNSPKFYTHLHEILSRKDTNLNFIIISFGSDLENIDMAEKLIQKKKEWKIKNLTVFVKVNSWHKSETPLENEDCYFIGNEKETVFDITQIENDKIFRMALMRNEVYDLEYDITHNKNVAVDEKFVTENRRLAYRNWYAKKSQLERDSSLYGPLSLRSKLNMMGLDYVDASSTDDKGLSEEEYLEIYAGEDMPCRDKYSVKANGKFIVYYPLDFPDSRRRNMAIHEHLRWNSFMISRGLVPSSIADILNETTVNSDGETVHTNGRNYALRRHGNLTTFDGLISFRRLVSERDGTAERDADVIKYDYQLLDDAHWLLTKNGYKIIKREN